MRTALSNARRDRITGLGVEVAFFAALALVPGLLVLVALLGSIEALIGQGLAERAEAVLLDLFRSILTEDAGDALAGVRRLFEEERPGLLTLGIASTLLALVRAFSTVFRALDVVYEVRVPRLWWQRRARAFALAVVTVIVAAVLLAVVVLGPLLGRGRQVADSLGFGEPFALVWSVLGYRSPPSCWWGGRRCCSPPAPCAGARGAGSCPGRSPSPSPGWRRRWA